MWRSKIGSLLARYSPRASAYARLGRGWWMPRQQCDLRDRDVVARLDVESFVQQATLLRTVRSAETSLTLRSTSSTASRSSIPTCVVFPWRGIRYLSHSQSRRSPFFALLPAVSVCCCICVCVCVCLCMSVRRVVVAAAQACITRYRAPLLCGGAFNTRSV